MCQNRKIAFVTGSRSEYGITKQLITRIENSTSLILQLILTGSHLAPEHGLTGDTITFPISDRVEMQLSTASRVGIAKSVGLGVIGFADSLNRLNPDIVVVFGDRYEMFAAAQAAMLLNLPIAHISGGETTRGSLDESMRHAISKMAHMHFVSSFDASKRLHSMGEKNVHIVGHPQINAIPVLAGDEFLIENGIELSKKFILVLLHPVTNDLVPTRVAEETLDALYYDFDEDYQIIVINPNADHGYDYISNICKDWFLTLNGLSRPEYLTLLNKAAVLVGNSSSGLYEAAMMGTPAVNIGDRQLGRPSAKSVMHCDVDSGFSTLLIDKILAATSEENKEFTKQEQKILLKKYFSTDTVISVLNTINLNGITKKEFIDV